MSKISRYFQKVFGSGGPSGDFAQFGSQAAGFPVTTKDIPTIQGLNAWLNGWQDAVTAGKAPYLEDMNGLMLVLTTQLAYVLQQGIAEWDGSTTYFTGGLVMRPGTNEQYISLIDNNTGNALPSQVSNANWAFVGFVGAGSLYKPGFGVDFYGGTVPDGWLLCDGSAVSRTTYASLFGAIGTTWGIGDGSTTFNVPDSRRRTAVGSGGSGSGVLGNSVGSTGGEEAHTLTTGEMPPHNHPVIDPTHSHQEVVAISGGGGGFNAAPVSGGVTLSGTNANTETAATGITIGNTGGGGSHNNIQPSMVVTKLIKT